MSQSQASQPRQLLAVDLGLKTGLALYGYDGRLVWYRSQHFPNTSSLRRAAYQILRSHPGISLICLEGGGSLADAWEREASKLSIQIEIVSAETWRDQVMYARQQRTGKKAKQHAEDMARRVIEWSGAPKPTSLRHDTCEAILIGLWAVVEYGWLPSYPNEILQSRR